MQLVKDKFYIWYNRIATAVALILGALALSTWIYPRLAFLHEDFGLVPVIFLIASTQLIYGLFFYKRQAQNNIWVASLLPALILALCVIGIVHNSGQLHSKMLVLWFGLVFSMGIFGQYTLFGASFVVTAYYLITATGEPGQPVFEIVSAAGVLGTYLVAIASFVVFKKAYIGNSNALTHRLSGELKNTQQQAEILVQSISDAVIVTDNSNKISLFNPAAEKITGWTVKDATGINVDTVIKLRKENGDQLDHNENPFRQVLKTGLRQTANLELVNRNNDHLFVSLVTSPIITKKGAAPTGTASVMRDISRARVEENRRAEFISTASHEMRTPLAAIEGYLQLAMNEKVSTIDVKARGYLNKALESTHRLGTLFQDLLTSAKAEDGRIVSHPVAVEMGSYLETLAGNLRFSAEKKGLSIDFRIGESNQGDQGVSKVVKPLYYAFIDPDRMQEVVINLFDNAVKYTDKGKITVALTGNDEVIQFFIKDTGAGIPEEDIPHLFQKFYRVDNSVTRTVGGTGLGLFISKKILELYHGRIWVESEVGKGTTFYINLPRLGPDKVMALQKESSQKPLQPIS